MFKKILIILGIGLFFTTGLLVSFVRLPHVTNDQQVLIEPIHEDLSLSLNSESLRVIDGLKQIETTLKTIMETDDVGAINQATLAFLRKNTYGYHSSLRHQVIWGRFAGTLSGESGLDREDPRQADVFLKIENLVDDLGVFSEPTMDHTIDFEHMMAVIDVLTTDVFDHHDEEVFYDVLFTWGGDLESFLINMTYAFQETTTPLEADLKAYVRDTLGTQVPSYFGQEDFYADLDGFNIAQMLKEEPALLSEVITTYYEEGHVLNRFEDFVTAYGGQDHFEALVMSFLLGTKPPQFVFEPDFESFYTGFGALKKLMLNALDPTVLEPSVVMRKALGEVFISLFSQ